MEEKKKNKAMEFCLRDKSMVSPLLWRLKR